MQFESLLLGWLLFLLCFAGCVLVVPRVQERFSQLESIGRSKKLGIPLTIIVMVWLYPNIMAVIAEDGTLARFLIPLLGIGAIACIVYLDFLFARAFAVFLILLAHQMLKDSYALSLHPYQTPLALSLMATGILGILLAAKPYWMRDVIRAILRNRKWQYGTFLVTLLLLVGASAALIPLWRIP